MKFKVHNPTPPESTEKTVRLKMEERPDGRVVVMAVDEKGERLFGGSLLSFNTDGTVHLHTDTGYYLGFKRDDEGRIVTNKEVV